MGEDTHDEYLAMRRLMKAGGKRYRAEDRKDKRKAAKQQVEDMSKDALQMFVLEKN